jgi:hypothetical protein
MDERDARTVDALIEQGCAPTCCAHCHQLMIVAGKHECGKRGVTIADLYELYFSSQ